MTHLHKDAGGHLIKIPDGNLGKCPIVCPSNCDSCASTYVISVATISNPGAACFIGSICSVLSGVWGTVGRSICGWSLQAPMSSPPPSAASIECIDIAGIKYWHAAIALTPGCNLQATVLFDPNNPCPPSTGWSPYAGGSACIGTITVV